MRKDGRKLCHAAAANGTKRSLLSVYQQLVRQKQLKLYPVQVVTHLYNVLPRCPMKMLCVTNKKRINRTPTAPNCRISAHPKIDPQISRHLASQLDCLALCPEIGCTALWFKDCEFKKSAVGVSFFEFLALLEDCCTCCMMDVVLSDLKTFCVVWCSPCWDKLSSLKFRHR